MRIGTTIMVTVRRCVRCGVVGLVAALLLAALAVVPPVATVRAATLSVTNCRDDGSMGSLRQVLGAAMANDTITFAQNCDGTTAPNTTITLTSTLTPTVNVTIDATVGGRTVTISGNNTVQLFVVNAGVTLGLTGLTLTRGHFANYPMDGGAIHNNGGTVNITGSTLSDNTALNFGGAIYNYIGGTVNITGSTLSRNHAGFNGGAIGNNGGTVNITNSTLSGNDAPDGSAILNGGTLNITGSTLSGNNAHDGGAIYNDGPEVNITSSTLSDNDVNNNGGAIYSSGGALNITSSTLSDNSAQGAGGAIFSGGRLTITDSTLSGNSAVHGGAVYNYNGTVTITGSTLSGNGAGYGGAIENNGTATITDGTLSGNTGLNGGAILNGGPMTITGSTLSGNSAGNRFNAGYGGAIDNGGALTLTLAVVAGNTASSAGPDIYNIVNYGSVTSGGGNVVGVPPLLGPLADNGGPVQTLALLPGSPAIDIAACPVGLTTDARAVSRPQGTNCDAGAYEARTFTAGTLTGNNQTTLISTAFGAPVGLTVTGADPVTNGQITFTITPGGTGASAVFGTAPMGCTNTSGTVSVCTVGMGGVTTSPTFTANGTVGGFTIVATATGVPTTTFTETNTGIAPTAANDIYTTTANTALTVNAATGVLANDTPGTPAATITANTQPAHGSVTVNADGSFVYTPTTGYVGADSFTYTLTNAVSGSTGTVTITVTGTAPTATNDSYTVTTGLTLTVPAATGMLANDTKGNPPATITANTQPAHGSVTVNADGSFVYTPTTGYVGADSFTYTLTNAVSGSTGTVNLTVTGTAPTATNDSYTVTTGLTLTVPAATGMLANDMKGAPVATISAHTQPAHGTLMLTTTDGSFVYTPTSSYVGADSFTYTLTNSVGTSTGTVSLTVTAATVTGLTTTAPTGAGSGNTGTASNPVLPLGGKLTLGTTASYNNGTTGTTSGISYTSSNPQVASVDPVTGVVTANTAGQVTITVTGPNGSRTTITITVPGTAGTGLMPLPQPMTHPAAAATAAATPLPQPTRHP